MAVSGLKAAKQSLAKRVASAKLNKLLSNIPWNSGTAIQKIERVRCMPNSP